MTWPAAIEARQVAGWLRTTTEGQSSIHRRRGLLARSQSQSSGELGLREMDLLLSLGPGLLAGEVPLDAQSIGMILIEPE